jgi:hypothetical protein
MKLFHGGFLLWDGEIVIVATPEMKRVGALAVSV